MESLSHYLLRKEVIAFIMNGGKELMSRDIAAN
jgi:hypothetical protein